MDTAANAWVVGIGVCCLLLLAGVAGGTTGPQSGAVGSTAADTTTATAVDESLTQTTNGTTERTVRLVTGQTVTVRERDGNRDYSVEAEAPMTRQRIQGDVYIYPKSVTFETYDRALFNVDRLVERNLTAGEPIPVIVTYEDGVTRTASTPGFDRSRTLESIDGSAGTITPAPAGAVSTAAANPGVDRIYLDREYTLPSTTTGDHNGTESDRAVPNASAENITVAVIDSGVNESHPDLDNGTEVYEEDFTAGEEGGSEMHGTHVAGIIAGHGDASDGDVTGVAPNASIMDLQVFGPGVTTASVIIDAIETAAQRDADVVSMSLGGPIKEDRPLVNATTWAIDQGAVAVIAAGNTPGRRTVDSPGITPGAITVGATNQSSGELAAFSSQGPVPETGRLKPDVVAAGVDVVSTCGRVEDCGRYVEYSGTSMATPYVSGVVALVRAQHPDWSPDRVRDVVESTADPVSDEGTPYDVFRQGTGLVDASQAVETELVVHNATRTVATQNQEPVSTAVQVTNLGTSNRTLDASAILRDAATGSDASPVAVDPTQVSIGPGETETLELSAEQNRSVSLYSGRLALSDGEDRYYAALATEPMSNVTVVKAGLDDTSVEDDPISIISLSDFDPGFNSLYEGTTKSATDGRATFHVNGNRAFVWSKGEHEPTGTPVLTYTFVDIVGNQTVRLDESETVTQRIDTDRLPESNLTTRAVHPTAEVYVDKPVCGNETEREDCYGTIDTTYEEFVYGATEPTVRVSPSSAVNIWTEFLLAPPSTENDTLDTETVYQLSYTERNLTESAVYRPTRSDLGQIDVSYFRDDRDERYQVRFGGTPENWSHWGQYFRHWDIGSQTEQTWYVSPNASQPVEYHPKGSDWQVTPLLDPLAEGERQTVDLGDHPMDPSYDVMNLTTGSFSVLAMNLHDEFEVPDKEERTIIRENGTVVREEPWDWDYLPMNLTSGKTYNLTRFYTQSSLDHSTRIVGSYRGTFQESTNAAPPYVTDIDIGERDTLNQVRTDEVPITLRVEEASTLTLAYSTASDPSTPYTRSDIENSSEWSTVDLRQAGQDRYSGTVQLPSMRGTVHLAVTATDAEGDTSSLLVEDSVSVDTVSTFATALENVTPVDATPTRAGVDVTLTNTAEVAEVVDVTVTANDTTTSRDLVVPGETTVQRFVPLGNGTLSAGSYDATVSLGNDTGDATITVQEPEFRLPGQDAGAQSVDDDPNLEDVDGNGETDIFDALTYYNNRDTDVVENNPTQFDYDGDGEAGTLFDALALYNEISGASS